MIKVTELTYSKKDFKDILRTVTPIQDDDQKMGLDPFPSTADLAIFASKVYSDKDDELRSGLPGGWELLTTAHNSTGYFGCLYVNLLLQQVVLAHRGTKLSSLGAVVTDIIGVWLNKNTDYMFSAITFGDEIKCAILELNEKTGVRFTLTVTGHSLGGWISQVTAITLMYLKRWDKLFVRVVNDDGIHAHTVVFDSPGVQDMVIKIQREYFSGDLNPYSIFRSLDISNIVIAVNCVNKTGYHVGTLYQISSQFFNFISVNTTDFKQPFLMHGIKYFNDAFGVGDVTLYRVKGWPLGSRELDLGNSVRLNCFSEAELNLVNLLRMVKQNEIKNSSIEKFIKTKHLFLDFTMDRKDKTVTLDNEQDSKNFVKHIKNALRWFSGELQKVMEEQKIIFTFPNFLLDMLSQECLKSIPDLPDCEDLLGLYDFTNKNNTTRVLYIQAADCSLEIARIYSILCSPSYPDIDKCIFVNWESVQKLKKPLTTKGLPLDNNYNLFVINIGSTTEIAQVQEFLKDVFSKFNENSKKKAVIVSQKNPDLFRFVRSFEPELTIRCLPLSEQDCLEFTLNNLKDTSRRELFSKEFIILGEQAMSLNSLLGENCQSSVSIDDVLKPFLKDLLTDESFKLNIPNNLLKFDQLDVMFSKINREVNLDSLTKLLREETCSLFVSRGVRQLLEPQLQEVPRAAERVLDVSGSSEEDFRQACLENSSIRVAYWLAASDGRIFLKEVYNYSFYLLRQFRNRSLVDLKKLVQKKNDVDLFVFVGVTDKETLMRYLNASPEVEMLFSTNLKFNRFQNSTTAENARGIDGCGKHTLEVVKEREGYLLVWRDSQGALDSLLPCLSSRLLSEEELCACKTVIISDLPGMGKSTNLTLISLSRHLVNSWVFRINLRDRPEDIKNLPEQMSVESVAHFLTGASCATAMLNLLRFCLQSQNSRQIHVLLDGFDEIRDEEAVEKILKLCHFLKNETTAKLIATTRDSHENVLLNRLSTVATKFKVITKQIQLNFLVDFWKSHVVLGQKEKKLRLFAQHLCEAAHKKLGDDTIRLIGIPLHMRMLAEAFLQQAEQFSRSVETIPNIIGINNVYTLFKKFTSVKRDIFLKEKISFSSYDSNTLCETLIMNHYVLAFEILDLEFKNKYLLTGGIDQNEMNRFGLTQRKCEHHCDFIHRTFAEYFCSQLLVLWLRRDNFHYMYLPIEEWFLGNLLINKDFKIVRMFMDEYLAEEPLEEKSKQLLYDNMSKCWSNDAAAFRNEDGETALHVAVKERNTNIIDLLIGGLATEQTREPFESILLARDYYGKTALEIGLNFLYTYCSLSTYVFGSNFPIKNAIKQMLKITHLPYELKYKVLLYTLFERDLLTLCSGFLLTCTLNEEDIQKALNRIEVLKSEVFSKVPVGWHREQAIPIFIKNFILNEQNDIAERKFLPLAKIHGETAVNIEARAGNYKLVNQFIQINHDVVNSVDYHLMTPLLCAAKGDHIELVKFLQQHGARLNASNKDRYTALHFAAENGNFDIVKYLLKHGADPRYKNSINLLRCAIDGNNMDVIYLISSKENIDQKVDENNKTPLHYAIERRKWAIAKYLLDSGADPNTSGERGETPLICLVSKDLSSYNGTTDLTEVNQRMEVLQILISVSKDNNKSDSYGRTPLHHAIKEGDKAVVGYLVSEVKVDINCLDNEGRTPLHYAIVRGHEEIVKYLISEAKVDINCLDNGDRTPLHYAIVRGHEEIVKYLISEAKVDINCSDKNGKTPLYYAVRGSNWSSAKYLLESGADSKASDHVGKTLLTHVVSDRSFIFNITSTQEKVRKNKGDRMKVTQKLMSMSVDINKSDRYGKTLLHYAIEGGDEEIVKYLISEVKVDVNCLDNEGKTPLYYALSWGNWSLAEYLLDSGADSNISDCKDKTPLMNAVECVFAPISFSQLNIVKKLISVSKDITTDINKCDHTGKTALHYAIERRKWAIAKYLLDSGADPNTFDEYDMTPVMSAVSKDLSSLNDMTDLTEVNQRMEILQILISMSKDNNKSDSDARTLLHHAIKGGDKAVVKYLVSEVKVDINCLDNDGRTPLHYAIEKGHEEIVKYLISEAKVDINWFDKRGGTPLIYAIEEGHEEIVKYLISEAKVDINCSDKNGETPLYYAVRESNWSSAKYLLESGADSKASDRVGKTLLTHVVSDRSFIFNITSTQEKMRKNMDDRMKITQILMSMCVDINKSDRYGKTLLHYAIEGWDMETVKYLISEVKVDVNCLDNEGKTPLYYALSWRKWSLAEYLLDSGADPNTLDEDDITRLMFSVSQNLSSLNDTTDLTEVNQRMKILQILQILISMSKYNKKSHPDGMTLLHHAIRGGDKAVVEYFIHILIVYIKYLDNKGMTPLLFALSYGNWSLAEYLLDSGADSNISDCKDKTPLMNAVECVFAHVPFSQLNIDKKLIPVSKDITTDINKCDHTGKTALHYAIERRKWAIAKYLLDSGADPNTFDEYDMTPLMSAVSKDLSSLNDMTDLTEVNQRMEILQILISMSKDNNKSDSNGRTLLHHAIKGGDKAVVKYLVSEVKVDINCLDNDGRTPLHYAIVRGHEEIVKYLISEAKVDINCSDKNGKTPLYYAVRGSNWSSAKYLLESGADSKVSDRVGKTLLMHVVSDRSFIFNITSTQEKVRKNKGDRMKVTQILMSMSVDINKSDRYGKTLLHYAIEGEDMEIVKYLISEVKVDVNCLDNEGKTPLYYALRRENWSLAEYLLDSGADSNISDCKDKTPLMNAVECVFAPISFSQLNIVKKLISVSKDITTDINKCDHTGKTALHYAIERRKWAIAKYLLDSGADPNTSGEDEMTPLMSAVSKDLSSLNDMTDLTEVNQRMEILQILISMSKDNNKSDSDARTLLHHAIKGGDKAVVKYLVSEVKVDINCLDNDGRTPLHYAIVRGHEEIVKYLISEAKVDINCSDKNGKTPLYYAVRGSNWSSAKYLLESGADSKVSDRVGKTLLTHVVSDRSFIFNITSTQEKVRKNKGDRMKVTQILMSMCVDINKSDRYGKTLLHYAIEGGDIEIVKYLISEVKVDVNCLDNEGKTPLYYALRRGKWSLAEYLLDSGADSNISDCKEKTPLMNAVECVLYPISFSQLNIVKKLISVSKDITTDINKCDHTGKTALHYAIEGGYEDIIEYLISIKVDINSSDHTGATALHYAIERNDWTVAKYLLKAGADRDISDYAGKTPLDYITDVNILNSLKSDDPFSLTMLESSRKRRLPIAD